MNMFSACMGDKVEPDFDAEDTTRPLHEGAPHAAVVLNPGQDIELHYFCLKALGEIPRLMLELAGANWTSVMC